MVRVVVALLLVARVAGLASGPDLIVNAGDTDCLAVSALNSSAAVVCYDDRSNSRRGVYEHLCV